MNDLIRRQAAIDAIEKYDFSFPEYMERFVTELRDAMKEDLKDDIANLPSAQPERKKGKWVDIHDREEWYGDQYRCSLCGKVTIDNGLYCPNCGAEMDGEQDE